MPMFVHQYIAELTKLGEFGFKEAHSYSVLICIGLSGELKDRQRDFSAQSTLHISSEGSFKKPKSLLGRVWPLVRRHRGNASIMLGRDPENDIVIPEFSLSRTHCAFRPSMGGVSCDRLGIDQWHLAW